MSEIRCSAGSNCNKDLFRKIESSVKVIQNGWNDIGSTKEGFATIILKANKSVNIIEYLSSKLELTFVPSSSGWTYKACCPFHKSGNERTASFFINENENRFYCQACGASGSIVDFISKSYNRPVILVAENILRCKDSNIKIDEAAEDKLKERKNFEVLMLKISDMHREFLKTHNSQDAIDYMKHIMQGLDSVLINYPEKVESNIDEIYDHFKLYLNKYQEQ